MPAPDRRRGARQPALGVRRPASRALRLARDRGDGCGEPGHLAGRARPPPDGVGLLVLRRRGLRAGHRGARVRRSRRSPAAPPRSVRRSCRCGGVCCWSALGVAARRTRSPLRWALVPLALAGAAAVSVEAAATSVLQEVVSDDVRATVLGLNDSVIVAAALVGSLLAPVSVEAVRRRSGAGRHRGGPGGRGVVGAGRQRRSPAPTRGLPSGVSGQETDADAPRQHPDERGVLLTCLLSALLLTLAVLDVERRRHPADRRR